MKGIVDYQGKESWRVAPEMRDLLNQKNYTSSDLKELITYRAINYWDSQGFLLNERESESQWRRFSFVELTWMLLLQELSQMGISLKNAVPRLMAYYGLPEELKPTNVEGETKDSDIKPSKTEAREQLGDSLATSITEKNPLCIRIYKEGSCEEIFGNPFVADIQILSLIDQQNKRSMDSYVQISISSLIGQLLATAKFSNVLVSTVLTDNEAELIRYIKQGDINEITVRLTEGKPVFFELKQTGTTQNLAARLSDFLVNGSYQDITYKTNGGKTVSFEKITKVKLK